MSIKRESDPDFIRALGVLAHFIEHRIDIVNLEHAAGAAAGLSSEDFSDIKVNHRLLFL